MKTLTCTLLFITIGLSGLFAQEEIVTKIRKAYTDYNNKLEADIFVEADYLPARYEIKTVQNRPGLGPVNVNFTYYFDEQTKGAIAEDDYVLNTEAFLRKVIITQSMPAFIDYIEIFYDEKGKLLFCYSKLTGYTCGEKRFYFDKGKMIKIKFNPIQANGCEDKLPDFTRTTGSYTKDDLNWEKWVIKVAGNHSLAFQNMFQSME
jgi:hypothetical protein